MTDTTLLEKYEAMSARVVALEAENRLLRQKLDQYIRHYFGGQRNEALDKHQLELLLQGLPNVIALPTPEPKPASVLRLGTPHPVRRMLAEDRLETEEIVIEPAEVQAQPEGWKKISEERTSQLDWVAPKIIKRIFIRPRYVSLPWHHYPHNRLNKAWWGRACWRRFWSVNMNITNRSTGRKKCSANNSAWN